VLVTGATVVVTGRNAERGEQTVAAIVAEGGQAEFLAADMNDPQSVRRLADQARSSSPRRRCRR
jgi:NAD(P)-dependent dehydrogenase (short-subunit alcohol dehydrogenase family)